MKTCYFHVFIKNELNLTMWGSKPKKQDEPSPDSDPTTSFLSSLQTPREIRKPIEVQERDKKEKERTADEFEIVYNPETDADHPYEKWRRNRILSKYLVYIAY